MTGPRRLRLVPDPPPDAHEPRPDPGDPFDDDVYVRGWWQRHAHQHGHRPDLDAAGRLDWARDGVAWQLRHGDPVSAVSLLDRLLDAPGADPAVVAGSLLQPLLEARGPDVADDVARLCAAEPGWRQAVLAVRLAPAHRASIPALAPYLP